MGFSRASTVFAKELRPKQCIFQRIARAWLGSALDCFTELSVAESWSYFILAPARLLLHLFVLLCRRVCASEGLRVWKVYNVRDVDSLLGTLLACLTWRYPVLSAYIPMGLLGFLNPITVGCFACAYLPGVI